MNDATRWRTSTFALAFLLLLLLVAWVMRQQAVARRRARELAKWAAECGNWYRTQMERQSGEIERLDLAYDELRRAQHHAAAAATTRPAGGQEAWREAPCLHHPPSLSPLPSVAVVVPWVRSSGTADQPFLGRHPLVSEFGAS